MKVCGIILLVLGGLGNIASFAMYGDIAVVGTIGSATALVSGIGLVLGANSIRILKEILWERTNEMSNNVLLEEIRSLKETSEQKTNS